ncbi:hypothetical protein WN48_11057 [Eufriesea mexicana]|nr:hypothetical protein WN48_11057 [Eufriesea mexicana]
MRERGRKYEKPVPASANSFPPRVLHVRGRECDVIPTEFPPGITVYFIRADHFGNGNVFFRDSTNVPPFRRFTAEI